MSFSSSKALVQSCILHDYMWPQRLRDLARTRTKSRPNSIAIFLTCHSLRSITGELCRDCTSPFLHSVRSTAGCSALRLFRYPHSLSPRRRLDPCMPHRPTGAITDSAAAGEVRNLSSVSREINIIRA